MSATSHTRAVALTGITGSVINVEAAVTSQLPGFNIIGLPDASIAEAKQRIRVACQASGLQLSSRVITVNLSPAELPKFGSGFDLSIALAALSASGSAAFHSRFRDTVHIGELGLDGSVRETSGTLATVRVAAEAGFSLVMVPAERFAEATLVPNIRIVPVASLTEAVEWHTLLDPTDYEHVLLERAHLRAAKDLDPAQKNTDLAGDMCDVVGHESVIEALTIAAAGGHHVSMSGPPGTGKTMLASRLPGLLPDLSEEAALEVTAIHSLSHPAAKSGLIRRPPLEAPHHTATVAAMVGTGSRHVIPGMATRASHGVLFLDEAPEFAPAVLETLRQPLESGTITLHRARLTVTLPARFLLVLASNPCPCGNAGVVGKSCRCSGGALRRYQARISGPLRDRLDMTLLVDTPSTHRLVSSGPVTRYGSSSRELRERVHDARTRSHKRLQRTPWSLNSAVSSAWLHHPENRLSSRTTRKLDEALLDGRVSMRGYDRTLRMAWTIADLEGEPVPSATHVIRASALRFGDHS